MLPFKPPNSIVVDGGKWHVSYNSIDVADYGDVTTALVIDQSNFYVLSGDHREGYKDLKTLDECKEYFLSHLDQINKYSEDPEGLRDEHITESD
jgi:hypothetical protein